MATSIPQARPVSLSHLRLCTHYILPSITPVPPAPRSFLSRYQPHVTDVQHLRRLYRLTANTSTNLRGSAQKSACGPALAHAPHQHALAVSYTPNIQQCHAPVRLCHISAPAVHTDSLTTNIARQCLRPTPFPGHDTVGRAERRTPCPMATGYRTPMGQHAALDGHPDTSIAHRLAPQAATRSSPSAHAFHPCCATSTETHASALSPITVTVAAVRSYRPSLLHCAPRDTARTTSPPAPCSLHPSPHATTALGFRHLRLLLRLKLHGAFVPQIGAVLHIRGTQQRKARALVQRDLQIARTSSERRDRRVLGAWGAGPAIQRSQGLCTAAVYRVRGRR